jgi:O-succinylbenzoate synthase
VSALYAAPYRLALKRPIVVGGTSLTHRDGFLIRVGRGYGDLCPLPGFSGEDLETAASALREGRPLPPSATWALASAANDDGAAADVASAALLQPFDPPPPGARALKLKVGRAPIEEELRWVRDVAAASSAELRLDGNRGLSLDDARRLADAAGTRLGFLEEPVAPRDLARAVRELPVALDETLVEGDPVSGAAAWVLKPTVLGAARTEALAASAGQAGVRVILSSAYESDVGLRAIARLAEKVAPDEAHGLGTRSGFAEGISGAALLWERWR